MRYKVSDTAEVWKPIKGFDGFYEVSNLGRVKALERVVVDSNGNARIYKERLKAFKLNHEGGYLQVQLWQNGCPSLVSVHRLVAETFIPNPQNLLQVNHKNENKLDNRAANLEWCTPKYNSNYGTAKERTRRSNLKPVIQRTKDGDFVCCYPSIGDAAKALGVSFSLISACCLGRRKSGGGYLWSFENKSDFFKHRTKHYLESAE